MFDLTYLHPMAVHFPIALLIVGVIADITGIVLRKEFFTRAAFYLLLLGTIGLGVTYFSGEAAGEGVVETGSLKMALETHEDAAELTLWAMVITAVVRIALIITKKMKGVFHWVSVSLFIFGVATMVRTAHYGGELVYKHAAGVQLQIGNTLPAETSEKDDD